MTALLDGSAWGLLLTGAVLAMALGAALLGASIWVPRWAGRCIPLAGVVLVAPLVIVESDGRVLSLLGLGGLGALLIAGFSVPADRPIVWHGAATVPGALMLGLDGVGATAALVFVGVPVGAAAIRMFERGHDYEHGLAAIAAAIAGGGAFLTVPDTEHIALIAGAGVAVGVLVIAVPRFGLGGSGPVWLGAFLWAVAVDGSARVAGIVGALGALGVLVIDPLVRSNLRLHRGLLTYIPISPERLHVVSVAALQTAIAVFTSRVAGLRVDVAMALGLTAIAWAVVGGALAWYAYRKQ